MQALFATMFQDRPEDIYRDTMCIMPKDKKDLIALRIRPDQTAALEKILKEISKKDKEASISSLLRRALDEFIERQLKK